MLRRAQGGTRDGDQRELIWQPRDVRPEARGRSIAARSASLARESRPEARVRATVIVMRHPLSQDLPQLPLSERDEMVETLAPRRSDQSLAQRVRLRNAGRSFQHA